MQPVRAGTLTHWHTRWCIVAWNDDLRAEVPRADIPGFLVDLQALVAALREDRPWQPRVTPSLRAHPGLVVAYLSPGPGRDAVAAELGVPTR